MPVGVAVDVSEASAGGSVSAADAELAVKAAASAAGEAAAKEAAAHYEPQLRAEEEEGEDDARTVIQRKRLRSSRVVSIQPGSWSSRRLPREHGIRGHDLGSALDFFCSGEN